MEKMPNGVLVCFSSFGSTYYGFIVGTCSYDNCGEDNAYVVRYVWLDKDDAPRRPYTIVAMTEVKLVADWPENFVIGGRWSASPEDRCDEWELVKEDNMLFVRHNEDIACYVPTSGECFTAQQQVCEWAIEALVREGHARHSAEEIVKYMPYEERVNKAEIVHGPICRAPYSPY